ncbi:hypothetical protein F2Q70_00018165 [Brassica cretica]|uniref:Uncharacterized protein n=1 Tax=Brassica cretica TaxID=69181 RepID=A0A8S9HWH9_BRACR|nr:hypothetical protein F2Q70_00018165 [Brassica cretica]KAF2595908.1 hypothetical protein F2Q68_00011250 [Brassica cretica]
MPSSTRCNNDKHLLFLEDLAHLERTIRKDQRSTSLDAAAFTLTDSRTQPSIDIRPSSSTDLHRSTSIDTTPRAAQPVEEAARPRALADYYIFYHIRSLKEISSELTIRGRYEEEAIVRCTSSAVDRYRREASTIENYDRSMYILYHRSRSRREMRDLVPADFKPKASPNYKITLDEFLT